MSTIIADLTAEDAIREAGALERYHIMLTQLGFDSCVTIAAQYTSASGLALTKENLYPALHAMIQKHGALSVQVQPGATVQTVPYFVRLREIDLDSVVDLLEDNSAATEDLLRSQLERPFALGTSAPLWRVSVVNGRTVVFAFHHCIGDGQSGPALHAALLSSLNNFDPDEHFIHNVPVPSDATLAPPIEAATKCTISYTGYLRLLYTLFVPKSLQERAKAWTANPVPDFPSLDAVVRCWHIHPTQTVQIVELCRQHNVTLTPFLHTLLVGVLSRLLVDRSLAPNCKHIATRATVSLRRFTGASALQLCDHVSAENYLPRLKPLDHGTPFPWDDARRFGDDLHSHVKETRETLGMFALGLRMGWASSYLTGMLGKKRENAVILSNLGRSPTGDADEGDGKWRLGEVYWAHSDVVRGPAIKLHVVGSPEGATNVTFVWGKDAVDDKLGDAFVNEMKATLDDLLR